jgi:hypothetical protein
MHKRELHDLRSSPDTIWVIESRWTSWRRGHVTHQEDRKVAHRILVGTPEGNRPLGRLRPRWENNSNTDFEEIVCKRGWIEVAQDRDK